MEGRRNKKRKKDRKEEGILGKEVKKKEKKRIKEKEVLLLALNRSGYFCWCPVCNGRGCLEGLVSLFSLPEPHSSAVVQPLVQFLWVLLLPTRPLVH